MPFQVTTACAFCSAAKSQRNASNKRIVVVINEVCGKSHPVVEHNSPQVLVADLKFQKRGQFSIRVHDVTLSVAAGEFKERQARAATCACRSRG